MRVAILSDIHGNALALEAVLADLAAQGGADALVVAGDLCLDGPRPREVLERLRALGYPVVQGNTDRDLVRPTPDATDAGHAALLDWTRERIGPEGLAYLDSLPFSHQLPDPTGETALLVVHANPRDLDTHLRPHAPQEAILPLLAGLPAAITTLAFGHLHIPYTRRVGGLLLADIASVGLPKDGDRRAGYGLFTWQGDGWGVEQRRVEYPVEEVVAQLRAADPPGAQQLIRQLLRARYPNMSEARGGRQPVRPAAPTGPAAPAAAPRPPRAARPAVAAPPEPEVPSVPSLLDEWVEPGPPGLPATIGPAASPAAEVPAVELAAESGGAPAGESAVAPPGDPPGKRQPGGKKGKRPPKGSPQVAFAAADSLPAILPRLLGERIDAVLAPMATVREDEDPEGVHDMRVAIRRLRAALEPAEPYYAAKGFRRALRRVKALARALGRVRDADVHLLSLRERLARASADERAGLEGFIDTIVAERATDRADLDPVLDLWEGHHAPHVAELRAFLSRPKSRKEKERDRDSVAAVAVRTLAGRLGTLEASAAVIGEADAVDPEAFHAARIAAKQLRYALEIFGPVLGPDVSALLAELKTLQDLLGELHDRDVMIALLHAERTAAAERELDALARAAFEEGRRAERLASVRAQLSAADGFAATAVGSYGLLIDIIDERADLERATRERWAALTAADFLGRLRVLVAGLEEGLAESAAPRNGMEGEPGASSAAG